PQIYRSPNSAYFGPRLPSILGEQVVARSCASRAALHSCIPRAASVPTWLKRKQDCSWSGPEGGSMGDSIVLLRKRTFRYSASRLDEPDNPYVGVSLSNPLRRERR